MKMTTSIRIGVDVAHANKLAVPPKRADNICKMNVRELGFRYVVELGGVSYDERGYLRSQYTKLLGEESKTSYKWSDLRNATQFYTEEAARKAADKSGLDGFKVLIKTVAFDEYLKPQYDRPWLWECRGGI